MARIAQRNLPIDVNYKIIDFAVFEDGYGACQNCNRVIVNVATVEDANGKRYDVGLNCAETLSGEAGIHLKESVEVKQIKKELRILRLVKRLAKEGLLVPALETLEDPFRQNWFFAKDNGTLYMWITPSSQVMTKIIEVLANQPEIYDGRFDARARMYVLKREKEEKEENEAIN